MAHFWLSKPVAFGLFQACSISNKEEVCFGEGDDVPEKVMATTTRQ